MNKKILVWISIVLGILCIVLAFVYWLNAAGSLPTFLPGYEVGVTTVHFKHGLGALILGLALFAFAWFKSGPKEVSSEPKI